MLAEERQNAIVQKVNINGSVLVKELSEQYGVTEDSIRKDLTLLEKKGLLKKTYGGAVKVRINVHDFYAAGRKNKNTTEKQKIAEKAYTLIEDGDTIFLDISTSNIALARLILLNERNVTVVTNMIDILQLFTAKTLVGFIFIGGTISAGKDGFTGALTNQEIEKYRFDKAFLGVVGADLENNRAATYDVNDATTKTTILACSQKSYMMLETKKLSAEGNYKYANIGDFSGVITELPPDSTLMRPLQSYGIDVL